MMLATQFIVPQNQRWAIHYIEGNYVVKRKEVLSTDAVALFPVYESDRLDFAVMHLFLHLVISFEEIYEVIEAAELFFRSMEVEQDESE